MTGQMWRQQFRWLIWLSLAACVVAYPLAGANARQRRARTRRLPQFEAYRVRGAPEKRGQIIGIGRPESNEPAAHFYERLHGAVKAGANFAGHYAVVGWSCGMICINMAILDVRTGKIYHTPFVGIGDGPCPDDFYGAERRLVEFRLDSRLFVIRGTAEDFGPAHMFHDAPCSTRYYVWRKNRLVLLRELFPRPS